MRSIRDLADLSGRKVLLTGGTGHIGKAVARALVELGASVAIVDVDEATCREFASQLTAQRPACAVACPCDLSSEVAVRATVHHATEAMNGLGILIHCAAFVGTTNVTGWAVAFEQQTVAAWDQALRVNLTAAFTLVQEAAPALAASGHGSVILFSSIYGMVGPDMSLYAGTAMANPLAYGASKGGLLQLMRYLATTLGPKVRVNAISPGGVLRGQPESFVKRYEERTPLRRMAHEEDVIGAVAYLASDLSAYVTGHNLVVDGGWTAW